MRVYLDVLFFINGTMDFLILTLLSVVFGFYGSPKRRVLASLIGALLACLFFVIAPFSNGIQQIASSLIISGILVGIAYGFTGIRGYVKRLFCLYFMTATVGGMIVWIVEKTEISYYIWLFLKTPSIRNLYWKSFLMIGGGTFLLLLVLGGTGKMVREEQQFLYPVTIQLGEKVVHTVGLLDTGNRLKEPKSQKGVLVGEFPILYGVLREDVKDWMEGYFQGKGMEGKPEDVLMIPFSSVGKKAGEMPAVVCDSILVAKDGNVEKKEVIVAITNQQLSPSKEYFLLLHTELFK